MKRGDLVKELNRQKFGKLVTDEEYIFFLNGVYVKLPVDRKIKKFTFGSSQSGSKDIKIKFSEIKSIYVKLSCDILTRALVIWTSEDMEGYGTIYEFDFFQLRYN